MRLAIVTCHLTNRCNLHCAYCRNADLAPSESAAWLDLKTLRRSAAWVARQTRSPRLRWVFFGGEPLLRSVDWLAEAIACVHEEFAGQHVDITMQTNGTLFGESQIELMRRYAIRPSISLDGPPDVHDYCRQGGVATWRGVRLLQEAGITPRVICVLTRHNYPHLDRVIDAFLAAGLEVVRMNFVYPDGADGGQAGLDAEQMFLAQRRIAERMFASAGRFEELAVARCMQLFAMAPRRRPDIMRACGAPTCGAGINHVAVNTAGEVYLCDRVANRGPRWRLGNVGRDAADPGCEAIVRRFHWEHRVPSACHHCRCRSFCHHPCSLDRRHRDYALARCLAMRRFGDWLEQRRAAVFGWASASRLASGVSRQPTNRGLLSSRE